MRSVVIQALRAYKYCLSPFLPPGCRFRPTCSEYAQEAVLRFGVLRGLLLSVLRVLRCQPLCRGGYDPVPETFTLPFFIKSAVIKPSQTRSQ